MKTTTVFTPTYNRAHCLYQVYLSLCSQTLKDFVWLIVDDGSKDNTYELVMGWQKEKVIEIEYYFKENGGLHTAYNSAINKAKTELFVCIDSDDFMPDDAVEKIYEHWRQYGNDDYAGIIGLDYFKSGISIGGDLPNVKSLYFVELIDKFKYKGDTKMVHKTKLLKELNPMPTFNNEKNFNPIYLFLQVDKNYPLLVLNENLCFVEYHPNGMSNNIFNQYIDSPNSFAELRRLNMTLERASYQYIFKNAIHYVSSCLFAKEKKWIQKSPRRLITILASPFGLLLYFYILNKTK
ncbi:MAG TPA: glycosyltransferase family 2 protein [Flavobacterium sp.]